VIKCSNALDAVLHANALVVGTELPELRQAASELALSAKPGLVVVDANRHLQAQLMKSVLHYIAVGTSNVGFVFDKQL